MVFTAKGSRISVRRADGHHRAVGEPRTRSRPCAACWPSSSRCRCRACRASRAARWASSPTTWSATSSASRALAKDDQKLPDAVFMFTDSLLVFDNLRHRLLVIANAHIEQDGPRLARPRLRRGRGEDRHAPRQARGGRPGPPAPLTLPPVRAARGPGRRGLHLDDGRGRRSWTACAGPRSTSRPATPTRSCSRGGSTPSYAPIRSRSIARSGPSTRRRISSSCASARPASWARRRRCWCGSRTVASRSGPSRAPIRAGGPRRKTPRLAAEMRADPKERAEHVMLVDLGRNDVGRVAADRHRRGVGVHGGRALLARHAPGEPRAGPARSRARTPSTCSPRAFPAGTLTGRPQGPRHGDHRGAGADPARPVRRRRRLHLVLRQPRLVHHHPHGGLPRPARVHPGRARASWPTPTPRRSGSRRARKRAA